MEIKSVNPSSGDVSSLHAALTQSQIEDRLQRAESMSKAYGRLDPGQRILWMKKLCGILEHEMEELAELSAKVAGYPKTTSRQDILQCADWCRYFAENAARMLGTEQVKLDFNETSVRHDPVGVMLLVAAWTSSLWHDFELLIPSLMAGNVVLLTHSESVSPIALEIENLVKRAGFPSGVLQMMLVETWQHETLLSDPRVAGLMLSGVGAPTRSLAARSAWLEKRTVARWKQAGSFIVMPSANLVAASQAAVLSRCLDNGQSGLSASRFLVHEHVFEEFALLFVAAMDGVQIGDPLKEDTLLGPLASTQALEAIEGQVAAAIRAGGRLLTGGQRLIGSGNFFEPTVIADVPRNAKVCRERVLGPVALLLKVDSVLDAMTFANVNPHEGVTSLWTVEEADKERFREEFDGDDLFLNMLPVGNLQLVLDRRGACPSDARGLIDDLREFTRKKTLVISGVPHSAEMRLNLDLDGAFNEGPTQLESLTPEAQSHKESRETQRPILPGRSAFPELEMSEFTRVLNLSLERDEKAVSEAKSFVSSEPFLLESDNESSDEVEDLVRLGSQSFLSQPLSPRDDAFDESFANALKAVQERVKWEQDASMAEEQEDASPAQELTAQVGLDRGIIRLFESRGVTPQERNDGSIGNLRTRVLHWFTHVSHLAKGRAWGRRSPDKRASGTSAPEHDTYQELYHGGDEATSLGRSAIRDVSLHSGPGRLSPVDKSLSAVTSREDDRPLPQEHMNLEALFEQALKTKS